MSVPLFHPVVSRWFAETFSEPTAAQRAGWPHIHAGRHTLIAAPTGSGKTLAAFLASLDELFRDGLQRSLPDEVRVVYVSPLKALSTDVHRNLEEPRDGIRRVARQMGLDAPEITAAVRTGDTTQAERAAMLRRPPHILVTTPESLYLLLTAEKSRNMLRTVRTVIVDEIHAVIGTRRGAHLALTLERLQHVAASPLVRVGLSATQKPIDTVARFLVGVGDASEGAAPACAIVDEGHRRAMDLGIELPGSPIEAVMAHEIWDEYYDRLAALIAAHRTTLVFVNTRRLAERVARHLSERLGEAAVTAHHGSLSKERRRDAEERLKSGRLSALVATASLELGIDIGHVDLVCQIGSPRRIATFLQRVGRSGHTVSGLPKGRLLPVSRDDLVECAALLRSVLRGELDAIVPHEAPLDVLGQQIVAEAACRDWAETDLFELVRRAWPYRNLTHDQFTAVVTMLADGFSTRRGRRAALVHRDEVHGRVRGRRGARLLAIGSGGAIPDVADYRVVVEPDDTFIGTLNEDFAIESSAGDIFQLGNASWRVLRIGSGEVRVADAQGAPPTIPFWLGEAPGRSDELSRAVSDLRANVGQLLAASRGTDTRDHPVGQSAWTTEGAGTHPDRECLSPSTAGTGTLTDRGCLSPSVLAELCDWLEAETGVPRDAADQVAAYLADAERLLGVLPTQDTLVVERFFDASGGMQLVLHAPFGSRVNKAWGLALRKRFCRQFNFELQAAATEDALLLSLGPQHSFPLADVFRYLHPATARDVLVQAFLDAPVFQTRWRWNTTVALAVPRNRSGRVVPPQLQRMLADDLMAAVFPDAAACLENIPGDRQIPDHPLVSQTVRDCLQEAMDFDGLAAVLTRIHANEIQCVARDVPEPSPLCAEILNARPYAFLDDAPLEERRAHAVYTRRAGDTPGAGAFGALDLEAIAQVRADQQPDPRDADELHDALLTFGFLTMDEAGAVAPALFDQLAEAGRAARVCLREPDAGAMDPRDDAHSHVDVWIAAERWPEMRVILPAALTVPVISPPATRAARQWRRDDAIIEMLRGRLALVGPTTAATLARSLAVAETDAHAALVALEAEGVVLRGAFCREHWGEERVNPPQQWCERSLLARIHRLTLATRRAEIEPVSPADFMRFLFVWQHVSPASRVRGLEGLCSVIAQLDGFELSARAWERGVLPARVEGYEPMLLDMLCLTGEVAWARLSDAHTPSVTATTPIALFLREHTAAWQALRSERAQDDGSQKQDAECRMPDVGCIPTRIAATLRERGASFARELAALCALSAEDLRTGLGRLVGEGAVTCDGFAGLRALAAPPGASDGSRADLAGRWSLVERDASGDRDSAVETQAWALLRRYGVVFRRLLARETNAAPWRELARVYRRLEARGEIRGGRFVAGMSGEQFALPDAVSELRDVRRMRPDGTLVTLSAADPLNLAGIVTPGDRVAAMLGTRIAYRDGVPLSVLEGDYLRPLTTVPAEIAAAVATALAGRPVPGVVSGYVGRGS